MIRNLAGVYYRNRIKTILSIAFLISLPGVSEAQQDARISAAGDLVRAFMAESGVPGVTVSVGIAGEIVWSEGFGYADAEQRVPVWPSISLFRIGSVAKPITATAVGLLVQQGKLNLDAPIQQYVPTFPEKSGTITTRLLAGHLAGIRHYRGDEFLSQRHYDAVAEGLSIFQDDPLLFEPGSAYSYSSYGWNLISAVVEGASGEEFLSFVSRNVWGPIGMRNTFADQVTDIIPNRGRYYELVDGVAVNAPPVDNSYKWAGGGFLSTSEDLIRFGFAYLYAEILDRDIIEKMWTTQYTVSGEATNYGIGWSTNRDDEENQYVGHTGGSVGGTTWFRIYPDQELVVALIANVSSAPFGNLPQRITYLFMEE